MTGELDPLEVLLDELNKRIEAVEAKLIAQRCIVSVGVQSGRGTCPTIRWRGHRLWAVEDDGDRMLLRNASIQVKLDLAELLPQLLDSALDARAQALFELPRILASIDEALEALS